MTVKRATLLNELVQRVRHAFSKSVKGDLRIFHRNVGRLSIFRENILPFSHVAPFGYDNAANDGTVKFLAKFEAIAPSHRK